MNHDNQLTKKYVDLQGMFQELKKVVIAFSGGVDSSFLLRVAVETLGSENVLAVTSSSETYPEDQLEDSKRIATEIGARQFIIYTSELNNHEFTRNDKFRCYYCKRELFSQITKVALEQGIRAVVEGSNYDDQVNDYRPGMKAAGELGVRSPLREVGLSKEEIRTLSKELGLSTWNKPSFACLSSRFPYGQEINAGRLSMVGQAEEYLKGYHFNQLRVRHHDDKTARIEVLPADMPRFLSSREEIVQKFRAIGYVYVTLDVQGYRTGSMNEIL